jgi:hypothetical protein
MPRQIETAKATAVWYTPDIDDNRDDPEPFRVVLTPLTVRQKRELDTAAQVSALKGEDVDEIAGDVIFRAIRDQVSRVVGYEVRNVVTGDIVAPHDGATLVNAVLDAPAREGAVLNDIYAAIVNASHLAKGVSGNFGGPLGSSAPTTQPVEPQGNGPATTAETQPPEPETNERSEDA